MRYLVLVFSLLCMSFAGLSAKEAQRTISVSGEAAIQVAPNQAIFSMSVNNKEKTLDSAKKANDKTIKSLLNYFTKELEIDPKHVQTDHLSVNPIYFSCSSKDERQGLCDSLEIQYFELSRGLQLRLDDLTKYDAVVAKSLELGVNKISNIQFVTSELRKHKDEARELAAIAAKEKAQAVAATLGMELGKPISINLNNVGWSYFGRSSRAMMQNTIQNRGGSGMDEDGSSLSVGQISITASVSVNFDMQ